MEPKPTGDQRPLIPHPRSLLFVPGSRRQWLPKALGSGADGLVLDLEDAVPPAEKAAAREAVGELIAAHGHEKPLLTRINDLSSSQALADLQAVVRPGLTGVMVPKIVSASEVALVDRLLTWLEQDRGIPEGSTVIVPVLETALALRRAYEIGAASPRTAYMGAACGKGGDMERAIGYRWTPGGMESLAYRSRALVDIRASGAQHPMLGVWTSVDDLDGLHAFASQVRDLGYEGMVAIHPKQVPVINEVFSLSAEEVGYYQGLIDAMTAAESDGQAAATYRGQMVDIAMAKTARERLARSSVELREGS